MKKKTERLAVTRRAVVQRLNRVLAKDELKMSAVRSTFGLLWGDTWSPGDFLVVAQNNGAVEGVHGDELEDFARKHRALKPWERLED